MGKTLDDFRAKHDPSHQVLSPTTVFQRDIPKGTKRFIVTAAQNGTPVHEKWWAVIQSMARAMRAEILVIPIRYKNPTSQWTGSQQNAEHWAPEVRPYLWNVRKALGPNITVLGDIKIQPTASSPLTGADALSHASSGIIGHTKLELRSIPAPQSRMSKLLSTSGACTVPNYTDSRSGKVGEFHHSLCAALVELDGAKFYLRQLHYDAKTNSCTDLDIRYTAPSASRAPRALALIMGDTHVDYICPLVKEATFGRDGMIASLRPQYLVWHDILDAYSINGHHEGNPFNRVAKHFSGADNARAEVQRAIDFLAKHTPEDTQSVVVGSNHNDMLRRWIIKGDWKEDPANAEFYLETALAMVRGTKLTGKGTEYPDAFCHWLKLAKLPRVRVLESDEPFMLGGVALNMHGDEGPNGARGSIKNHRRLGVKTIIGHSHSPGIDEGCTQVGTSTRLRLEYNTGPSSWLNCHAILQADGKRQLIIIVDGQYKL